MTTTPPAPSPSWQAHAPTPPPPPGPDPDDYPTQAHALSPTQRTAPAVLSRAQRGLITVVVAGAVVIAGSYAAVRELAIKKGFGNFSYVFPIGIDAGICVLLALDLLLTWIRIPFPLLRQTAWLLTIATIAFKGAAAWPDPLGVGMHAVIPILFVVSVEAARHAIGRIADITADKHMEGVRLTRWMLSPIPTFLLWRRMKLWELRSYEQVIKLEQERLVYQARLHARFGRAWRRKAPVESLMPLRLARYGVPLAETAPSGLAAAGIEPSPQSDPTPPANPAANTPATHTAQASATPPQSPQHPDLDANQHPEQPEHTQPSWPDGNLWFDDPLQGGAYEGGSDPTDDQEQNVQWYAEEQQAEQHEETTAKQTGPEEAVFGTTGPAHAAAEGTHPRRSPDAVSPPHHAQAPRSGHNAEPNPPLPHRTSTREEEATLTQRSLTPVDRYYLAWHDLQQQREAEPDASQLSAHLARQGILDHEGQPIKAKTLARYLLQFRIYTIWARHRNVDDQPALDRVTKELAQLGITAQYNRPIHMNDLDKHRDTFERRWQTLHHQGMS